MAKKKRYPVTDAGTELTPEVVDELAKEAEEGYDLSKGRWVRVRVGRPSLSENGCASPRINVRLPADLRKAARRKADEDGVSMSELTREAIRRYVRG